jgi:two-component system chemotaxis sensor kinase CheA
VEAPQPAAGPQQAEPVPSTPSAKEPPARRRADYLRVDVRKLDQLMDLMGELIIAETAVTHGPAADGVDGLPKAAVQLNRVTRGLQDVVMSLRMVPIEPTFKKMVRLVRDLSKRQGKRVQLVIEGQDTEVDKSVVEAIADPLVHLIRNAIDHGIEPEAERIAAGKPAEGRVTLTAQQQAGEIRIILQDDGKGLDHESIIEKALNKGILKDNASAMSPAEAHRLIFEPGFSTASTVTDISGRGVGMDVVKANIEAVKGRVGIESTLGQGTRFTLRIPLTLAIIEGMLVQVGDTCFTVPILSIRETVRVGQSAVTRLTNGQEVVRIRNQLVPLFRLHAFYDIPPRSDRIEDGLLVVVEDGRDRLCLLVDELVGQRQTVIKSLSGYLGNVRGLAGCTVLGDGSISLIVDVAKLIQDTRLAA